MKRFSIVFAFLLLAGAGCFGTPPEPTSPPAAEEPTPPPVVSVVGAWKLVAFTPAGGEERDAKEIGSTLTFGAEGRFSAVICNSMSGDYSVTDGEVKAPEITSTLKFCTGLPGEVEAAFTQGMAAGMAIEGGDMLVLRSDAGAVFAYERDVIAAEPEGEDRAAEGAIVSIDLSKIPVDGPAELVIEAAGRSRVTVLVPSFGLRLCAAYGSIADVYSMKVGQRVEVNGSVGEGGAIVPCTSASHYLRLAE